MEYVIGAVMALLGIFAFYFAFNPRKIIDLNKSVFGTDPSRVISDYEKWAGWQRYGGLIGGTVLLMVAVFFFTLPSRRVADMRRREKINQILREDDALDQRIRDLEMTIRVPATPPSLREECRKKIEELRKKKTIR